MYKTIDVACDSLAMLVEFLVTGGSSEGDEENVLNIVWYVRWMYNVRSS